MENTKTLNVVSTNNIEGNIGSCTTKNEKVTDFVGFWRETGRNVTTNSCTGAVSTTPYTEFAIGQTILILVVVLFFGFIVGKITGGY